MINDRYLQAFAHFYRGEMNRLTCYRTRLDGSFHYAILFTSTMIVLYLQQTMLLSSYFPFVIILMNLFFCFVEARRYRYYLISQDRVTVMEQGFLCHQILDNETDHDWKQALYHKFIKVQFTRGLFYCFTVRYFRNYMWLIDLIAILWILRPPPNLFVYYGIECFCALQHIGWIVYQCYQRPDI